MRARIAWGALCLAMFATGVFLTSRPGGGLPYAVGMFICICSGSLTARKVLP